MQEPIIKRIEVPCSQKMAFTVFIDQMHTWWPMAKFTVSAMKGAPAETIRVDPREGGKIIEVGSDGSEVLWGKIRTYDPYAYVSMDFHVPTPETGPGPFSLLEISFTAMDKQRTLVELKQSGWEVFADMAEGVHGGYSYAWTPIFEEGYKAACERA